MLRLLLGAVGCAAALAIVSAQSTLCSDYVYDLNGARRDLSAEPALVFVTLNDTLAIEPLLESVGVAASIQPLSGRQRRRFILRTSSSLDSTDVLDRLASSERIGTLNRAFSEDSALWLFTDEIVVKPSTARGEEILDSLIASRDLQRVHYPLLDPFLRVARINRKQCDASLKICNYLFETNQFEYAKPDLMLFLRPTASPNDTLWSKLWHFQNTGQSGGTPDVDIDLDDAWNYQIYGSDSLIVAILDEGFKPHADLPAAIWEGFWNPMLETENWAGPGPENYHGMACAGIIAATRDNNIGVAGVAANRAKLFGVKIIPDYGEWIISDLQLAAAFDTSVSRVAQVISNSWICDSTNYYCTRNGWPMLVTNEAIARADSAGVLVVAATGNGAPARSWVSWPASLPSVLAVGAVDSSNHLWYYSQRGPGMDVVAPSADINGYGWFWTTDLEGANLGASGLWQGTPCLDSPDYMCNFGGTSAAAPIVAGIAALIKLRRPDLLDSAETIKRIIRYSAEDVSAHPAPCDTCWTDNAVGWGRVNAARALLAVARGDADNNGRLSVTDVIKIHNYIFAGGSPPQPHVLTGDANGNGSVTISDVQYLVAFIFQGGPRPPVSFKY